MDRLSLHRTEPPVRSLRPASLARLLPGVMLLAGFSIGQVAAESVSLRYRPKPNAIYEQSSSSRMSIQVEVEGGAQDQMAIMQQMLGGGIEQSSDSVTRISTGKTAGDGSIPFQLSVESVVNKLKMGGREMPVPSSMGNPGETVFSGSLSADGRTWNVDEMKGVPKGTAQQLMSAMPRFPDADLSVGDDYEVPLDYSVPVPTVGGDVEMKGTAVYTLERIEGPKAHFSVRQSFSVGVGGEGISAGGLNMAGGGLGSAVYDRNEGMFDSIKLDMNIQMGIAMGGGMAGGAESAQGTAGARMKIKMTGPVEMTIKRLPEG